MRTLTQEFCERTSSLFKKYKANVNGDLERGLKIYGTQESDPDFLMSLWTKRMIHAVYDDWKDQKLTDSEFAHLVDQIMCY